MTLVAEPDRLVTPEHPPRTPNGLPRRTSRTNASDGAVTGQRKFQFHVWRDLAFDIPSGQSRAIYSAPEPSNIAPPLALSPEGRTVAFTLPKGQELHLATVGVEGKGFRDFNLELAKPSSIAWSGEGRSLYCIRNGKPAREVWRVPAGGGAAEFTGLDGPIGDLTVSADGSRIAYTERSGTGGTKLWALEHIPAVLRAAR